MVPSPIFAIVTPFDQQDRVDADALAASLRFLSDRRAPAIVTGGTTGEFPSLALGERTRLFRLARASFSGKIIQNISTCCVRESRLLAQEAEGADGLLLLPPYYYRAPDDEGILDFYTRVLEGLKVPTYLYHFPAHTQAPLSPDLVARIRDCCPCVVGLKDSGGDFEKAKAYKTLGEDFEIFVGMDTQALSAHQAGLAGVVSGAGMAVPEYLVQQAEAWQAGDQARAAALQDAFDVWTKFRKSLGADAISLAKYALRLRVPGFPEAVRPPLRELSSEQKSKVEAFLAGPLPGSELFDAHKN